VSCRYRAFGRGVCWTRVAVLSLASWILSACGAGDNAGAPSRSPSPAASTAPASTAPLAAGATSLSPATSSAVDADDQSPQEDPWVAAITAADFPLFVGYGLPDDRQAASEILDRSFQLHLAKCMEAAGFTYLPEDDDNNVLANSEYQTRLPEAERARWLEVMYGASGDDPGSCRAVAAADTWIANASPDEFKAFQRDIVEDVDWQAVRQDYARCAGAELYATEVNTACAIKVGLDAILAEVTTVHERAFVLSHRPLMEKLAGDILR